MYRYTKIEMTIRDFLLRFGEIDCQPVGQRLTTEIGYGKKARGIINTILMGMDLGQITIHETKDSTYVYESIDGGHRKRFIKAYFEDLFPVNGKYFRELSDSKKRMFLDTRLSFVIYTNLTVYDIGYIFRTLNETTDVNHQEMLNSYGNIPIANSIRNTVRPVKGINNKFHKLFAFNQQEGKSISFNQLQFDNMRLRIDEMVARVFYRYYDGAGLGKADEAALKELYEAELSQLDVDKINNRVNKCLDFLYEISEIRKRYMKGVGLSQSEFSLYTRIWLYIEEEYGSFRIPDYELFYREINRVYAEFMKPATDLSDDLKMPSPFDSEKTIAQQFRNTLGEHRKREHISVALMWLIERADMQSIVLLKDKRRLFPRAWREAKLAEQGYKCAVTNKPITMANAEGGHIVAHANGGRTTYDNLAMICADVNKSMGTMSIEQYKELINE